MASLGLFVSPFSDAYSIRFVRNLMAQSLRSYPIAMNTLPSA